MGCLAICMTSIWFKHNQSECLGQHTSCILHKCFSRQTLICCSVPSKQFLTSGPSNKRMIYDEKTFKIISASRHFPKTGYTLVFITF